MWGVERSTGTLDMPRDQRVPACKRLRDQHWLKSWRTRTENCGPRSGARRQSGPSCGLAKHFDTVRVVGEEGVVGEGHPQPVIDAASPCRIPCTEKLESDVGLLNEVIAQRDAELGARAGQGRACGDK